MPAPALRAAQHQAVLSGAGIGVLPAFLVHGDARLQPVLPAQVSFVRAFWMSMLSPESRGLHRIQAIWVALRGMAADAGLLVPVEGGRSM
ncbi:hypothetical protein [Pseudorhodoferax sp.]|uniref:hypothetical protein n=1 Tax=Pseudorhodoferax sp. TaxID=1993553 RepID=UPI0039E43ED1